MRTLTFIISTLLVSCSFEAGDGPAGTPWDLADTGLDAQQDDGNSNSAENSALNNSNNSQNSAPNNSTQNNSNINVNNSTNNNTNNANAASILL